MTLLATALTGGLAHAYDSGSPGRDAAHEFYFTRGIYGGGTDGGDAWGPRWAVDYPKADQQLLVALRRLTIVDAFDSEHALRLDDPSLLDFPFVYVLEVGSLTLSDKQAKALRNFLLSGGFMVIDDFWGTWEWDSFEEAIRRVFPERAIREIPLDHPVFNAFYEISEVLQVPNVYQAGGGVHPRVRWPCATCAGHL